MALLEWLWRRSPSCILEHECVNSGDLQAVCEPMCGEIDYALHTCTIVNRIRNWKPAKFCKHTNNGFVLACAFARIHFSPRGLATEIPQIHVLSVKCKIGNPGAYISHSSMAFHAESLHSRWWNLLSSNILPNRQWISNEWYLVPCAGAWYLLPGPW